MTGEKISFSKRLRSGKGAQYKSTPSIDFSPNLDFSEVVKYTRKKFDVPEEYSCHVFQDNGFGKRLKQFKFSEVEYSFTDTGFDNMVISQKFGAIKEDFFIIVNIRYDEATYHLLFLEDMERFNKEFFKIEIKIGKGLYKIERDGGMHLVKVSLEDCQPPILNDNLFDELMVEIDSFVKGEKFYKEEGLDYKRGYLLYGNPGVGKTSFVKYLLTKIDGVGVICNTSNADDIEFIGGILMDKSIKNELKIVILEDIDGMSTYVRSTLLNLLDGVTSIYKVIFIATTNFPDKLDVAITNRPSRFDGIYQICEPNESSRGKLLERFFSNLGTKEKEHLVELTKGLTGAHFKEIFLITKIHQIDIPTAIEKMKRRIQLFEDFTSGKGGDYIG